MVHHLTLFSLPPQTRWICNPFNLLLARSVDRPHPLMLCGGYARIPRWLFASPAIAGTTGGRPDAAWARAGSRLDLGGSAFPVRHRAGSAPTELGLVVLDPVENALPCPANGGTVMIPSLAAPKRGAFKSGPALLATSLLP